MKIYEKNGFQVHHEITSDYVTRKQTYDDLLNDLSILKSLIPEGKKIVFQVHFRPNIIYNDQSQAIPNREEIYNCIKQFCDNTTNCYLYDPSLIIRGNLKFLNGPTHLKKKGHRASFNYMYDNYIAN
jgi:hypothetical protein